MTLPLSVQSLNCQVAEPGEVKVSLNVPVKLELSLLLQEADACLWDRALVLAGWWSCGMFLCSYDWRVRDLTVDQRGGSMILLLDDAPFAERLSLTWEALGRRSDLLELRLRFTPLL